MRSVEEFDAVMQLIAAGFNDCEISRTTGIPRTTIRGWRHCRHRYTRPTADSPCGVVHNFAEVPARGYAYLLGMYLGDGYVSRHPRTWRLRVVLDTKYPGIIEACRAAMNMVMPGHPAAVHPCITNCVEVSMYSKHWPCLFPQHGPGRKHARPIRLEPWQQALVKQATEDFIRGLIDSDGCRVVANDRGVRSIRYHFTNLSGDIRSLFTDALDDLGIPWTQNAHHMIAVYRKTATARMDEFVGPKSDPRPAQTDEPRFRPDHR